MNPLINSDLAVSLEVKTKKKVWKKELESKYNYCDIIIDINYCDSQAEIGRFVCLWRHALNVTRADL